MHAAGDTLAVRSRAVAVQLGLCVLATACIKVPEFQGRGDGGPGDGGGDDAEVDTSLVSVKMNGDGAIAKAPGYELRFSDQGAKFPYQLNVGGNMIMGGSEQCADEYGMGIALYPATRVNGVTNPTSSPAAIEILASGPYVGQLRIKWSADYPCTGGAGSIGGTSVFSFFPDGRLVRKDLVNNTADRMVGQCTACGMNSSNWYLTSYTTLIVDSNATLSDGTSAMLDNYGEELNPGATACIRQRGSSIAFSWLDSDTRMRAVAAPPTSQARTISFVKNLFQAALLPMSGWETTTQMAVSTDTCGMLEARLAEFSADDHHLTINSNSVGAALTDGIFGDFPRADGYPVDFPVTITPSGGLPNMPAGFAVWLYSAPIPQTLTLTHSGNPTGTWYYEQRVSQNSVLFWFNVPLETGQTITINAS